MSRRTSGSASVRAASRAQKAARKALLWATKRPAATRGATIHWSVCRGRPRRIGGTDRKEGEEPLVRASPSRGRYRRLYSEANSTRSSHSRPSARTSVAGVERAAFAVAALYASKKRVSGAPRTAGSASRGLSWRAATVTTANCSLSLRPFHLRLVAGDSRW